MIYNSDFSELSLSL